MFTKTQVVALILSSIGCTCTMSLIGIGTTRKFDIPTGSAWLNKHVVKIMSASVRLYMVTLDNVAHYSLQHKNTNSTAATKRSRAPGKARLLVH